MRSDGGTQITIRIHEALIERADALVDFVGAESGATKPTRADVWREAVVRGLRDLERAAQRADKKRQR